MTEKPKTTRKLLPDAARLHDLFRIEGRGLVRNSWPGGSTPAGARVGTITSKGFRSVMVDGSVFLEHRLVWKMHTMEEPPMYLDHINADKDDNRFENLRQIENGHNKRRAHRG